MAIARHHQRYGTLGEQNCRSKYHLLLQFYVCKIEAVRSNLRSVLQRSHIDHKAILHIAFLHTSVGFIDILNLDHFHI